MKPTKLLILASLALGGLLMLIPAGFAQDATNTPPAGSPPGPGMRGRMNFDRLAEQLNLTDDQKPKVKEILANQMQQMRDLRQDDSLSADDRRAKMKSIREDTNTKLKGVLTADQFQKWQEMQSRMRGPRNRPPGEGGTNAPAGAPPQN
jgi:Spy/CpxP family protein refolding chaperone